MTLTVLGNFALPQSRNNTGRIPVLIGNGPGWLHEATGRRGVVLCGALDYEALCTWRPLYTLADRLAAAGCPTVRFDYPGHGESAAPDPGADFVSQSIATVHAAVDLLKTRCGVEEVVLIGLRFGALIAPLAAQTRPDIVGVALLAPPSSGRAFARALTVQARLLSGGSPADSQDGSVAIAGFTLSPACLGAIKAIKPLQDLVAPRLLVLDPAGDSEAKLAEALSDPDMQVEREDFPGYGQMMQNPTLAQAPVAFDRVVAWATADMPGGTGRTAEEQAVMLVGPGWREEVCAFGPDRAIAGTLCMPFVDRPGAPLVLIASAGRNPRAGWGRSAVNLARLLAADGIASFRYDGRGLGDGAPLPTAHEPLYSAMALEDAATVLDVLAARGYGRIVIVGACSGAWIAFHTAVADRRIVGLVAINLLRFIWKPGESLTVAMRQTVKPASFYRNNLFSSQIWKRLAKGDIDLRSIAVGLVQRKVLRPLGRVAQMTAARLGLDTPITRVRRWIGTLEARDVAVLFVMSDGDPSLDERAHYFGNPPAWLHKRRNVREMLVEDSDHDLTPRRARNEVDTAIRTFVDGLCLPASVSRPSAASTGH